MTPSLRLVLLMSVPVARLVGVCACACVYDAGLMRQLTCTAGGGGVL